jgi:hypothetical protein
MQVKDLGCIVSDGLYAGHDPKHKNRYSVYIPTRDLEKEAQETKGGYSKKENILSKALMDFLQSLESDSALLSKHIVERYNGAQVTETNYFGLTFSFETEEKRKEFLNQEIKLAAESSSEPEIAKGSTKTAAGSFHHGGDTAQEREGSTKPLPAPIQ